MSHIIEQIAELKEITMLYPKDVLIKLHRELWNWLAANPEWTKGDWPKWKSNGGPIPDIDDDSFCFACHYDTSMNYLDEFSDYENEDCENCLFVWPQLIIEENTHCHNSYFHSWEEATNRADLVKYAKLIATLKVKENVYRKVFTNGMDTISMLNCDILRTLGVPSFTHTPGDEIENGWENEKFNCPVVKLALKELGFKKVNGIDGFIDGEKATYIRKKDNTGAFLNHESLVIINLNQGE